MFFVVAAPEYNTDAYGQILDQLDCTKQQKTNCHHVHNFELFDYRSILRCCLFITHNIYVYSGFVFGRPSTDLSWSPQVCQSKLQIQITSVALSRRFQNFGFSFVAWELSLRSLRWIMFGWDLWLGTIRLWTFAWDPSQQPSLTHWGSFACGLLLGIFRLGASARDRWLGNSESLGIFRLAIVVCDPSLENSRLGYLP